LVLDLVVVAFVILLGVLGWFRGLISQVVTIGAFVALWLTKHLWLDAVSGWLAGLGQAMADHEFLRRMVAFWGAYFLIVVAVFVIERLVVNKVGPLKWSNHWAGAALGGVKGIVYAVLGIWAVQSIALWDQQPDDPTPAWVEGSFVVSQVGPYNPVRLFSLREIIDETVERMRAVATAMGDDDSAGDDVTAEGERTRTQPTPRRATTRRRQAVEEAPPVHTLIEEAARDGGLDARTWRQLYRDPRVRRILADPRARDLLFGK